MGEGFKYIKSLLGMGAGDNQIAFVYINPYTTTMIVLAVVFAMPIRVKLNEILSNSKIKFIKESKEYLIYSFYVFLLLLSIIELAQSSYNPFIYFRF